MNVCVPTWSHQCFIYAFQVISSKDGDNAFGIGYTIKVVAVQLAYGEKYVGAGKKMISYKWIGDPTAS